jgi:hypothetical protein
MNACRFLIVPVMKSFIKRQSLSIHNVRQQSTTTSGKAKLFFEKVKRISLGFIAVFKETKEAYYLRQKPARTRREQELIRSNGEAITKVAIFGVLQAVPIVGYIPVFVALAYPRQILSSHFWSDEERERFMIEEYNEKQESKDALRRRILDNNENIVNPSKYPLFIPDGALSLEALPSDYVISLATSNGIFTNAMARKYSPDWFVRKWLKKRAHDIAIDDKLLLNAAGVDTLDYSELRLACLRRGCNPSQPDKELRTFLKQWLLSSVVKQVGKAAPPLAEATSNSTLPNSLLLHACGVPEAFTVHTPLLNTKLTSMKR